MAASFVGSDLKLSDETVYTAKRILVHGLRIAQTKNRRKYSGGETSYLGPIYIQIGELSFTRGLYSLFRYIVKLHCPFLLFHIALSVSTM